MNDRCWRPRATLRKGTLYYPGRRAMGLRLPLDRSPGELHPHSLKLSRSPPPPRSLIGERPPRPKAEESKPRRCRAARWSSRPAKGMLFVFCRRSRNSGILSTAGVVEHPQPKSASRRHRGSPPTNEPPAREVSSPPTTVSRGHIHPASSWADLSTPTAYTRRARHAFSARDVSPRHSTPQVAATT